MIAFCRNEKGFYEDGKKKSIKMEGGKKNRKGRYERNKFPYL